MRISLRAHSVLCEQFLGLSTEIHAAFGDYDGEDSSLYP